MNQTPYRKVVVAGSGTIATGLAAVATSCSAEVVVLTRSGKSTELARRRLAKLVQRVPGGQGEGLTVTEDASRTVDADFIVEAVIEDLPAKVEVLSGLAAGSPQADLATTTSSLRVAEIARRSGCPERLVALHVFNPVTEMELIELCCPEGVDPAVKARVLAWCQSAGKTAVEVPDTPGFVVNRLLFPYLFDAVRLGERTGLPPEDVDRCMTLGPNHPLGPHALLDLVGLDVAVAIGQALEAETGNPDHLAPPPVLDLVAEGHLGRKSGRGFFSYASG